METAQRWICKNVCIALTACSCSCLWARPRLIEEHYKIFPGAPTLFSAICKQPIIQDIKDKGLDFGEVVLVLDEVQDTRNLGSCLRSASFFGVDSVIIPKNNSADFFNTAAIETSTGGIYDLKL